MQSQLAAAAAAAEDYLRGLVLPVEVFCTLLPPDWLFCAPLLHLQQELHFTKGFPGRQPTAKFVTNIWHPNIAHHFDRGRVCVNFAVKQFGVCSVPVVLSGLQMLLRHPNPNSPLNGEAADQLRGTPARFSEQAAAWTRKYAM